jgi:hypothetical protein
MSRFRAGEKRTLPPINTASLPDCIFLLLFFFMVTTHFRQTNTKVIVQTPRVTEIKKLEKKSLVSYIYVGKPIPPLQAVYGTEPRIQLNDAFATVDDIRDFISSEREQMTEEEQKQMTVSLKIDNGCCFRYQAGTSESKCTQNKLFCKKKGFRDQVEVPDHKQRSSIKFTMISLIFKPVF